MKDIDVDVTLGQNALKTMLEALESSRQRIRGRVIDPPPMDKLQQRMVDGRDFYSYFNDQFKPWWPKSEWKKSRCTANLLEQFLNRVLGLSIEEQKVLSEYFFKVLDAEAEYRKALGELDHGIMKIREKNLRITKIERVHYERETGVQVKAYHLESDVGITFEEAIEQLKKAQGNPILKSVSGFYKLKTKRGVEKKIVIGIGPKDIPRMKGEGITYIQPCGTKKNMRKTQFIEKYCKITDTDEAKSLWEETERAAKKKLFVLCGTVLGFWVEIEEYNVCQSGQPEHKKFQVCKGTAKDVFGGIVPFIGINIPSKEAINNIREWFASGSKIYD